MIINGGNLRTLRIGFNAAFNSGLGLAESAFNRIAMTVPSNTGTEEYGWLNKVPGMREWIGDRVIHGLSTSGYAIKNKTFELTIAVDRDHVSDDSYGLYNPLFTEMGMQVASHPDQLVFALLKAGPSTLCYDGQYFFDTDHPVIGADGVLASQANWDNNSGTGTPWYLLCTKRAVKPIIFQDREKPKFVSLTAEDDANVFHRKKFVYGAERRGNVGYGFWQFAYGSRKALDETNLNAAYTAFAERTGDHGRPLGIIPDTLVVPPGQAVAAKKLVAATTMANGATNVMNGLVEVLSTPWLV